MDSLLKMLNSLVKIYLNGKISFLQKLGRKKLRLSLIIDEPDLDK